MRPAHDDKLKVKVQAPDLCGRFSGRIVRNVNTRAKTPQWMVDRLARCGQRSVTALVDISNYVMFEFGRPSHIFDLDKIHGGLEVRWGRPGEQLKLLNGNTVTVDESVGVIADDRAGRVAGRHHGRRLHRGLRRHAQRLCRSRVLVARRPSRDARAATTSLPMPAIASSVAWIPSHTVEHIEHITRLIQRDLRRRSRSDGRPDRCSCRSESPSRLRVARAAKVIGMPLTAGRNARTPCPPGPAVDGGRWHAHGEATAVPFRHHRSRKT